MVGKYRGKPVGNGKKSYDLAIAGSHYVTEMWLGGKDMAK